MVKIFTTQLTGCTQLVGKPASWVVLRLFWFMCMLLYKLCLCPPQWKYMQEYILVHVVLEVQVHEFETH